MVIPFREGEDVKVLVAVREFLQRLLKRLRPTFIQLTLDVFKPSHYFHAHLKCFIDSNESFD